MRRRDHPAIARGSAPGPDAAPEPVRKHLVAVLTVASALLGLAVPSVAAAQSDAKVVIIVGADTPQYLDDANELYAEAIQHTSNVDPGLQPERDLVGGQGGDGRRERRDLPRPRQRLAEPVQLEPERLHDEGRLRAQRVGLRHALQPQVLR